MVALTHLAWQHRFERSLGTATCDLTDLSEVGKLPGGAAWICSGNQTKLKFWVDPAHLRESIRIKLPISKPIDFLHLRFEMKANHLQVGHAAWDDGRAIIEWHPPGGDDRVWENDHFASIRDNQRIAPKECVMRPESPPALPVLRLENLGVAGEFELSMFEATVLKERALWKWGRWVLFMGFFVWGIALIRFFGTRAMPRAAAAAMIWVLVGTYFVIPGPWKIIRSLGSQFELGEKIKFQKAEFAVSVISQEPKLQIENRKSVGKIPHNGDFILRLKHYAVKARPLLHALLLFGPALVIACLVGWKPALSLTMILMLGVELAQWAFGYGFDWIDAMDLVYDSLGITLALLLYWQLKRRFSRRRFSWVSRLRKASAVAEGV